ncbi:MAG: hypothetical protein NTV00_09590 [Methylococcales bacterium]|nr:hypothetical protein [Methylococcales bacterium]
MKKCKFAAPHLLALMLLGFNATSQANDTFDPASKTLTLPLVTVGNTTYSNVVLKLNNFDLLQIDPNPLVGKVDGGFLMQFVSAVKQGKQVTVTMLVTSQFRDRTMIVGNYSCQASSYACARLTDDKGNAYDPTTQVGNSKANNYVDFPFTADIPMTVTFTYDNVATNATSISLLNIALYTSGSRPTYELRNVPFK